MKDATHVWALLQARLRERIGDDEYEAWLAPLRVARSRGPVLSLLAPSRISADYIRDHYLDLVHHLAVDVTGRDLSVTVSTASEEAPPAEQPSAAPRTALNSRYTFASFVPGPSNQFARAAALSVAESPGQAYNPLFLYAGSGLGKTHLLHAIGNEVRSRNPRARVCYVPTEQFVNELMFWIGRLEMPNFREVYRSVDVLLLDDVHMLGGKERTQEEFFHTFNALHEAGHQLVLTSDTTPANIQGLEERLRTRFVWGLVADIQAPDLETKCAIVREKAQTEGVVLPDDVVLFVARRVRENIRELEGYLNRVLIYCTLTAQPPTLETTRAALESLLPEVRRTTPAEIIRFIAHHYGVKVADLKGRNSRHSVAFPRHVAIYLIRQIIGLSYPEIAKLFGKHHSTIMHSVESIAEQRRTNPSLDSTLTTFAEHFR